MTREQFRTKVKELHRETKEMLDNRIEKILKSGCVELRDYDNDYLLPKAFICAFADEIKFQFKPGSDEGKREVKNISLFM